MNRRTKSPDANLVAAAVTEERLALCEILDRFEVDDWATASLCDGWTVRDVVGHLALATQETLMDMAVAIFKARGNFDRMVKDTAITRARQVEAAALVEQVRSTAGSTRRAPMSSHLDPLVDILVHTQDISRPLGRDYSPDSDHVKPALDHAVNSRWYGGMKRFAGIRVEATDADWAIGSGDRDVAGPAVDLLLIATGRAAGFDALAGPGVVTLKRQLVAHLATAPT